jgi:hypothetical protein
MHLKNRPVYFVKDGNRRAVYYSVDARELAQDGWVIEQSTPTPTVPPEANLVQPKPDQEPTGVADIQGSTGIIAEESVIEPAEPVEPDLNGMTRAELMEFAEANGIEFKSNAPKADILEACKEFVDD